MARIRTIKPETWTDDKFVALSAFARLLFIGLWNFADDEGRMPYSPKSIKLRILPADKVNISALIEEIRREGMIQVYEVDGVEYLQVVNFEKHQKVDKRNPSKLPAPPNSPEFPRAPDELPRISPPDQGRDQGREGIKEGIKEGKGGGPGEGKNSALASATAPPTKTATNGALNAEHRTRRGTRLPDDWQPSPADRAFCESRGLDPGAVAEAFGDYWRAKAGANATKLDWSATWRNWCRHEPKRGRPVGPGSGSGSLLAAARKVLAHGDHQS